MIAIDQSGLCGQEGLHTASCIRRIVAHVAAYVLTEDEASREALLEQFRFHPDVSGADADLLSDLVRPLSESIPGLAIGGGAKRPSEEGAPGGQRDAGLRSLAVERDDSLEHNYPPNEESDDIDQPPPVVPPRPSFFEPIDACPGCGSGALKLGSRYAEASDYEDDTKPHPFLIELAVCELGGVFYGIGKDGIAHVIMPGESEVTK